MKIAILGFGTVGKGVYEILTHREQEACAALEVAHIFIRKGKAKTLAIMRDDIDEILNDPTCSLVVEVMGGIEPAHTYIVKALEAGKHVVTANKAVVAAHFEEFHACAAKHQVQFRYEASCGGGIPWLHALLQAKRIDAIHSISGILNGTSNYIIDQMVKHALDFDTALAQAQQAGYAEADPSADIDGIDTANKAMISASLAFDTLCIRDFPTCGTRRLQKSDLQLFLQKGCSVRLMMQACCQEDRYACVVEPMLLAKDTLEANVPDNFNLTTLTAKTLGELKLYGQGAGALPTGNAVVSDLIAIAKGEQNPPLQLTARRFDDTLLQGDYLLRQNGQFHTYHNVTPTWMHALYREVLQQDETAFLIRVHPSLIDKGFHL